MSSRPNRPLRADRRHLPRSLPIVGRVIVDYHPNQLRKQDCPRCVAAREADWAHRWPIGWCGDDCLRKLEKATWGQAQ